MQFAGKVWKLLVGIKDGLVLLFMLLFFGLLYAAMTARPTLGAGERGALLLDLDGPIVEQPAQATASELLSGGGGAREYRLRDVVHALETAADRRPGQGGRARSRHLLGRRPGDFGLGRRGARRRCASRASRCSPTPPPMTTTAISSPPMPASFGSTRWAESWSPAPAAPASISRGCSTSSGSPPTSIEAGTYKAAVEPFTRNDMSPEAREALRRSPTACGRAGSRRCARPGPRRSSPPMSPTCRRADRRGRRRHGAGGAPGRACRQDRRPRRVRPTGRRDRRHPRRRRPGSFRTHRLSIAGSRPIRPSEEGGEIGILTVAGDIVDGEANLGTAGAETIVQRARGRACSERNLKALVLRVDSPRRLGARLRADPPGGARRQGEGPAGRGVDGQRRRVRRLLGGDGRRHDLRRALAPSPARSACSESCPSFEGTMAKLGLGADGVKTTPLSGEPDLLRGPSPEADRLLQMGVDGIYRRFLALVSAARKMPVAQVDQIAQGRIWDGGTARQLRPGRRVRRPRRRDRRGGASGRSSTPTRPTRLAREEARFRRPASDVARRRRARRQAAPRRVQPARRREPRLRMLRGDRRGRADGLAAPPIQARCLECAGLRRSLRRARAAEPGLAAWLTARCSGMRIRAATPDDAAAIAEIYAPFVTDSAVSFETEPPGRRGDAGADGGGRRSLSLAGRRG